MWITYAMIFKIVRKKFLVIEYTKVLDIEFLLVE